MKTKEKHTAADVVDGLCAFATPKHPRPIFAVQDIEPVIEQVLVYLRRTEDSSLSFQDVFRAIAKDNRIRILDSTNAEEYFAQDLSPFCFGSGHSEAKPTPATKHRKRPR